jgi:hypothetical protein
MGEMHGSGMLIFKSMDTYEGPMEHNKMHGETPTAVGHWWCMQRSLLIQRLLVLPFSVSALVLS